MPPCEIPGGAGRVGGGRGERPVEKLLKQFDGAAPRLPTPLKRRVYETRRCPCQHEMSGLRSLALAGRRGAIFAGPWCPLGIRRVQEGSIRGQEGQNQGI